MGFKSSKQRRAYFAKKSERSVRSVDIDMNKIKDNTFMFRSNKKDSFVSPMTFKMQFGFKVEKDGRIKKTKNTTN